MARIKVPEFKVGDKVDPDKFNEAFSAFKVENLILEGDNFADESLSVDQIPDDICLTDGFKILRSEYEVGSVALTGDTSTHLDPWRGHSGTTAPAFTEQRISTINHPNNNRVTLNNLTPGDQFIIRASCNIQTFDGGWRTFMFGIPPIIKIGLYRFDGEGVSAWVDGSINSNSFPLHETLAHYRIAFTGKVPSSSSLNSHVSLGNASEDGIDYKIDFRSAEKDSDGNPRDHLIHRDTRADPDTDDYGDMPYAPYMPFDGYHSYTTAYLYTHSATDSTSQSFGIMCSEEGGKVGYKPDGSGRPDGRTGGKSGCEEPNHQTFYIKDLSVYVYEVKK